MLYTHTVNLRLNVNCSTCCEIFPRQYLFSSIPTGTSSQYSLDELEEMVLFLQQFCSVQCYMEEQLSEDQTSVYGDLSDLDRYTLHKLHTLTCIVCSLHLVYVLTSTQYLYFIDLLAHRHFFLFLSTTHKLSVLLFPLMSGRIFNQKASYFAAL